MKVLVTGGCGYKGAVLVPKLLAAGHAVEVWDTQWFGNPLREHERLSVLQCDVREARLEHLTDYGRRPPPDVIIHLAGIANDPCGELDAKLTWEVNVLGHHFLCDAAARAGVRQFIYASSASVYGLKGNVAVTETDTLAPVSDYNKTKMCAERILLSYADQMAVQIVRPATICGYSPRMRLDTMVNMLTAQAVNDGVIRAHCGEHGGALMRPNTHIEDITDLYVWLIAHSYLRGVFNAGFENLSAMDTAARIAGETGARVEITTVKDKRSYAVSSARLLSAGFQPKHDVLDAIKEVSLALKSGVIDASDPRTINLSWMRSNGWVTA